MQIPSRPLTHTGKFARGILRPCYEHHAKSRGHNLESRPKFEFLKSPFSPTLGCCIVCSNNPSILGVTSSSFTRECQRLPEMIASGAQELRCRVKIAAVKK